MDVEKVTCACAEALAGTCRELGQVRKTPAAVQITGSWSFI